MGPQRVTAQVVDHNPLSAALKPCVYSQLDHQMI